jgi:hypothetical protein
VKLTIEISSPGARLYGYLLVGREQIGQWVEVKPGVIARRTQLLEPREPEDTGLVTVALAAADTVTVADLADWLHGRLSTYRGRPIAPETLTIDGHTIEFGRDEIARAIEETMQEQKESL